MKYTMTVIDSEEKFTEKFGIDPQWTISTASNGLSQKQLHLSESNLSFSTRFAKGILICSVCLLIPMFAVLIAMLS